MDDEIDRQIEEFENWAQANQAKDLPQVSLPGGGVTISDCGEILFGLIGPTRRLFVRNGTIMTLVRGDHGLLTLAVLRPAAARSLFEKFGRLFAWRVGKGSELVLKPMVCPGETAEALLETEEARNLLPTIKGLINCPVMYENNGQLAVAGQGYDEKTHLLVTGGDLPPTIPVREAVAALQNLLLEFDFFSDGDRVRALASLISPALKFGNFLKGRIPVDVAEADQSQSGKTYRQKVTAALYNEQVSVVTMREGGVGSVDESFDDKLVQGRPFIQLDNFRRHFASAHIEGFMTVDGLFSCRVPYRGHVMVSPQNYVIGMTSNGVDTTPDFANRANIIRNKKKPPGFEFRKYEEGDLLLHVRKKQFYYLGCVFAIIREWHRLGKQCTRETRHDFREWVQLLDWIVQNIFGLRPMMDGHQDAQGRVSNPALVWLRNLVLAVSESGDLGRELTATDIYALCDGRDIEIPGLRSIADEDKGKKVIGGIMAKLFRDRDTLDVGGFIVTRAEKYLTREDPGSGGNFKSKIYTVTRL